VPTRFEEIGADAVAFIQALGLTQVDALGISIGGFAAQEITLQAPELVRKLVLVGTGPRGGEGMATLTPEAQQIFAATYDPPDHLWLAIHFGPSDKVRAAGLEFLKRKHLQVDRDSEVKETVGPRQIEAIVKWGVQREGAYSPSGIKLPLRQPPRPARSNRRKPRRSERDRYPLRFLPELPLGRSVRPFRAKCALDTKAIA
jgi:pimeloyl-ACP methyl ester carboxylesterase